MSLCDRRPCRERTMPQSPIGFNALNAMLKAAGETTRLRVLALLAEAELTVS